jgi:hypothetical protein
MPTDTDPNAQSGTMPSRRVPRGVLAEVGRELHAFLEDYARGVLARIVNLAASEGVDGFYVSFVLIRPSSGWPIMRLSDREALEIVSRLLIGYATLPSDAQMQVPSSEDEISVDRTLRRLAAWTRATMIPELKREYLSVIDGHTHAMLAMRESGSDGQENADVGVTITMDVMQAFEYWLCDASGPPSRRSLMSLIDRLFA